MFKNMLFNIGKSEWLELSVMFIYGFKHTN